MFGAKNIFTTAGTDEKSKFLESKMKATKGFNYKTEDWAQGVMDQTGGAGVDVCVRPPAIQFLFELNFFILFSQSSGFCWTCAFLTDYLGHCLS